MIDRDHRLDFDRWGSELFNLHLFRSIFIHVALMLAFILTLIGPQLNPLNAQETLSVYQYLTEIIKDHPQIEMKRFEVKAQNALWQSTLEKFSFNLNSQLAYNKDSTQLPKPVVFLGSNLNQFNNEKYQFNVTLSRPFQLGSTLSLDMTQIYTQTNNPFRNCIPGLPSDQCFEQRLTLRYTQSLLQGRGEDVTTALQKQAQADIEVKKAQMKLQSIQLLESCLGYYLRANLAQKKASIQEQNLKLVQEELLKNEEKVKLGALASNELSIFKLAVEQNQQNLSLQIQSLSQSQTQMLECVPSQKNASDTFEIMPTTFELKDTLVQLEASVYLHPQIQVIDSQIKSIQTQFPMLENLQLPKLDLDVFVSAGGLGDQWSDGAQRISNPDQQNRFYGATLTFQKALSDEALERKKQAFLNWKALENQKQAQSKTLTSNLRQAYIRYQGAERQIELKKSVLKIAQTHEQQIQEKLAVGRGLSFELIDAQERILQAQMAIEESLTEKQLALMSVWALSSQLLDRLGIVLDETKN